MDNRICVEIINSPHTNSRRAQIDILLPTLVKQFFDESVQLLIRTKWITNLCKIQIYVRFSCCHISFKIRLLSKIFPKFFNKTFSYFWTENKFGEMLKSNLIVKMILKIFSWGNILRDIYSTFLKGGTNSFKNNVSISCWILGHMN